MLPKPAGRRGRRVGVAIAALLSAAAASAITWIATRSPGVPPRAVTRFSISLPPGQQLPGSVAAPVAISPDGRTIAYVAAPPIGSQIGMPASAAGAQLYLRRLDQLVTMPLAAADGGDKPSFSPDGQWLAFVVGGTIKKVALSGGAARTIGTSSNQGYAFTDDGSVVTVVPGGGLVRIPAGGGAPQPLSIPDRTKGEVSNRWPHVLPGSSAVLRTVHTADISSFDDARIDVLDLTNGKGRVVVQGGSYARYIPTGHIVYARRGSLLAVPFDLRRLEVIGPPVSVLDDVSTDPLFGSADFAISRGGTLVYAPGGAKRYNTSLIWVDRSGREELVADIRQPVISVALAPDEERIAIGMEGANPDLWIYDIRRTTVTPFVHQWNNAGPVWTPDGRRIVFRSNRDGGASGLFWRAADGTQEAERLMHDNSVQGPGNWSSDGRYFVFYQQDPKTGWDVWVLTTDDRKARPLVQTSATEVVPVIAPDGHWLAYDSNQSGRFEVYVRPFPDTSRSWQVSVDGGSNPGWARNGRELYFRHEDQMMAVDVAPGADFLVGKPKLLFAGPYSSLSYDVARDGRFLMIKPEPQPITQLNVVENWFEELKRLVPTK